MASNEPHAPRADRIREPVEDALERLEERLDRASQAAERLLADAAQRMTATRGEAGRSAETGRTGESAETGTTSGGGGKPPPAGYQQPADAHKAGAPLLADADLLLALFGALRERIPPDLQLRLAEAIREVLLALRALIDWYLERIDRARSVPAEVQDIPIL